MLFAHARDDAGLADAGPQGYYMLITLLVAIAVLSALLFLGYGFYAWTGAAAIWLLGWRLLGVASPLLFETCVIVLIGLALIFGLPPLRRLLISSFAMKVMAPVLPRLGDTERMRSKPARFGGTRVFGGRP